MNTPVVKAFLAEQRFMGASQALQAADFAYVLEIGDMMPEGPAAQLASDPNVI